VRNLSLIMLLTLKADWSDCVECVRILLILILLSMQHSISVIKFSFLLLYRKHLFQTAISVQCPELGSKEKSNVLFGKLV